MYKSFQKEDWLKLLNLPNDYSVDGLLICGSYSKEKELNTLLATLNENNYSFMEERIEENFFQRVNVFVINGKRIWFDVVYGGAYESEMVHLASMFGSKVNIFTGSCGCLIPEGKIGDIVVPTYSFGDESTTRLYQRENLDYKHYVSEALASEITSKIPANINVFHGGIVTCQAMMAETKADVDEWSKEGYIGVEMETSTFIAVSNHFKVPNAAILHISDNLITNELVGGEIHKATKELRDHIRKLKCEIALKILLSR
jgi:purine-nucleoside phosphorylase